MDSARNAVAVAILVATQGLVACGDGGGERVRATFRDSAGIAIVENPSPDDSAAHVWWRVGPPLLDIGGEGVGEAYTLFRVADAARLSDGRIVVGNGGSADLRYYDASGVHLTTVGRRGGGPGEFQGISKLMAGAGDTLFVFDIQSGRLSVVSPEPAFVRSIQMQGTQIAVLVGRLQGGGYVGQPFAFAPDLPSEGLTRGDAVLAAYSAGGELIDTIGRFPGPERVVNVDRSRSGGLVSVSIATPPFGKTPTFALSGTRLYVGSQDAAEIGVYDLGGTLERIVRTGRAPQPVTQEHVDAYIEQRVANAPPEAQAGMRTGMQTLPTGEWIPPYGSIQIDAEGNLWVSDYDHPLAPGGRWTVYAPDGSVLARVALPARFRPYQIGPDWVLGRELDDLDVEHIRLYPLDRNAP